MATSQVTPVQTTITLSIHVAWWLRWYLSGVAMTCAITGLDPDMDKVERVILKALAVR